MRSVAKYQLDAGSRGLLRDRTAGSVARWREARAELQLEARLQTERPRERGLQRSDRVGGDHDRVVVPPQLGLGLDSGSYRFEDEGPEQCARHRCDDQILIRGRLGKRLDTEFEGR